MNAPDGLARTVVDGVPFVASNVDSLARHICERAAAAQGGWVVTPNIDILRRLHHDPGFKQMVGEATVFTADGKPIVWASRLQGTPLPCRLAGSDLFIAVFRRAAAAGLRLALVGGNPGTAEQAAARLAGAGAAITRSHCPPFGFENQPEEMARIRSLVTDFAPHIVFVGLGSPKQEWLIQQLRSLHPQAWFLGVGISFSFVAGEVPRAPKWMQAGGLEWLHRLVQEPQRLARRYLIDGLPFALGLMARSLRTRLQRRPRPL
ncbi:WecB/TagA/CpsF family glycosyltransferase [Pseudorhodoferax aquiterrae]|uniref:WecB/TagA/CpsF family glycosyltransferase n=1 Tax=Pseudorhodoferax aquiterrae TaxID=747304 RepID=UPI00167771AF|nr:WecB/TagA/CpsF family glycosyltransferase [Pseudorhodoferax aquiterrae]